MTPSLKQSGPERPITRSSKRIKIHVANSRNNKPEEDEEISNVEDSLIKDTIADDAKDKTKKSKVKEKNYQCSVCDVACKSVQGVRAHYIVDHVWQTFEYSSIMTDKIENLQNIFIIGRTGKFECVCGAICPDKIHKGYEVDDFYARQWIQVHRLVDTKHYKPSKTHRFSDVFPADLVLYEGSPWNVNKEFDEGMGKFNEDNSDGIADLEDSLPDIDKYSTSVACKTPEPVELYSEDDTELPDIDKYSTKIAAKGKVLEEIIEEFSSEDDSDEDKSPVSDGASDTESTSKNISKFIAKKDRKKDTKAFSNLKRRAKAEAQNYEIRMKCKKSNSVTFEIKKTKNTEPYTLTFGEKNVTCSCKSFKQIEERRYGAANEVCKHAALITLYCHENLRENYNGQRWFSTRSAFARALEMLDSFDSSRNIFEKPKHANFSLYPPPIPNPQRKFPYYKKKESGIFQMRKLKTPKWVAEKYNRDTNQGDKPACKVCKKKIALGNLCLRVDYTYLFVNRNFRSDEYSLKMSAFRICVKVKCFNDLNLKLIPKKNYREESNLPIIDRIDLANIFDNDKVTVRNMFRNEDVVLDNE